MAAVKMFWQVCTIDKPARLGNRLWDVFVVQFAAWLDRLTLRKVIALIPVVDFTVNELVTRILPGYPGEELLRGDRRLAEFDVHPQTAYLATIIGEEFKRRKLRAT